MKTKRQKKAKRSFIVLTRSFFFLVVLKLLWIFLFLERYRLKDYILNY